MPTRRVEAFTTGWLGENEFAATPAAAYGIVALMWLIPDRRVERALAAGPRRPADAPPGD
jgi:hypothetical protein